MRDKGPVSQRATYARSALAKVRRPDGPIPEPATCQADTATRTRGRRGRVVVVVMRPSYVTTANNGVLEALLLTSSFP